MRDFLFRGRLLNRAAGWSFGNLVVRINGVSIITPDETVPGRYGQVDPLTVGQYTGLTDRNGVKIFEGDILGARYDDAYPDNVTVEVVKWFRNAWCTQQEAHPPEPIEEVGILPFSEVIGNIYDNPEFLGDGIPQGGG